jgi:acetyl-CoA synthetase
MVEITCAGSWNEVRAAHRWDVPERYNLAWDLCGKWADAEPDRLALVHVADGVREYRYGELWRLSARLANVVAARGVTRGDRVGVLLPQAPQVALTHIAAYRIGAIVVPLFTQFGADALSYRLGDSGAKALITDHANLPKIAGIRAGLSDLAQVWCIDGPAEGAASLPAEMERASDECPVADTGPEDSAFITYTSGTTGPPKGALHGHRALLGHIPGLQLFYDFWPQPGDRLWTPSDWAWLGGLGNVMMPALRMGVPLVAHAPRRFDPEEAMRFIAKHGVTSAFLAPTALKLMRQVPSVPKLPLRSVGSGGESLGAAVLDWGREALSLTISEFYGQTECNLVVGNCARILPVRPGSMGRAVPGKEVAVMAPGGRFCAPGETGEIAVRRGDPAMFLRYWQQPEKSAEKFVTAEDGQEWMLTGDEGSMDGDGYFWFASRTDDVITSSGYRVGPSEIEECLNRHPAVAMSACIGVPDPVRTEVVKAFVVLAAGRDGSPELADELRAHVRARLSPHLTPREIDWAETLPMTSTGKIMRRELRRR